MLPVWGTAAVLVAPPVPLLTTGYVAGNTLPAQYWNYLFFHLTKELNNVLTAAGVAQSGSVDTQLLQSIRALQKQIVSTSGALGTLTVVNDTDYILTAASTATLPAVPDHPGLRLTFKAKTNATSTFTANAGQTIGTTGSTSFVLYAQEDYVTLEWDGSSIWYVVATNGPVQISNQSGMINCSVSGAWTAMGGGLSFGSINPGVYDIDLDCSLNSNNNALVIAIGNGTTVISAGVNSLLSTGIVPAHVCVRGYVLSAAAILQGVYYSGITSNQIYYATPCVGRISLRRVG